MADRDWSKELAKVDKQLASLSDDELLGTAPKPAANAPRGSNAPAAPPAAKPERKTNAFGVYARVLLAIALGVATIVWPYENRCGVGLAGYLAAATAVVAGGLWASVWTWRHRAPRAHTLSLLIVLYGLVIGSLNVLPRIGYGKPSARYPANWSCANLPPSAPPTTPPATPSSPAPTPSPAKPTTPSK